MYFSSDNSSPAHPKVLEAISKANEGYMPSYGTDPIMDEVRARIRETFEAPEAAVYLVATGSTANALSLACFCPPWATVFCHRNAHIEEDECGAPEFYTGGAKMTLVEGPHAKMTPANLRRTIEFTGRGGVHNVQRGMVSITNVTEAGTVYTTAEVAELAGIAKEYKLPVHLDGARFANALATSNASPAEMTWRAGVDVLSFGGTKNGLIGVEAVVIFDPAKAWEFELRRKRGGHLFSKHRYLSAQMLSYLEDNLWLDLARASNRAAQRLSDGILKIGGSSLIHPADANMVFPALPRALHRKAMEGGAKYYIWPGNQSLDGPADEAVSARLVCSWCTTDEDVDGFLGLIS
ncbi:low specificity L-threonine aldolase [Pseudoruegeria sp. HB172150]|uniref:threonine aldolase family protein n=1 Tax=Pseudoruegeria sp. HB172150 TaxID=2721164 RepID=UPI001556C90B|nr:low specificity L-threonine aldolase [Pseudoruegeria sp. HB172150]